MNRILGAVAAAAIVVLAPSAAGAVPYGPGDPSVSVSDVTPAPGQSLTLSFGGFSAGESVEIDVSPEGSAPSLGRSFSNPRVVVGTTTADSDGEAVATLVAPSTPGTYVVTATGLSSGNQAQSQFTVDGAVPVNQGTGGGSSSSSGSGSSGGGLPATGSDAAPLLRAGVLVLALGAGLVGVAMLRRRRPSVA